MVLSSETAQKIEKEIKQPTFAIAVQDSTGATQAVWLVVDSETVLRLDSAQTLVFTPGPKYDEFNITALPKRTVQEIDALARSAKIAVSEKVAPPLGRTTPGSTAL